MKQDSQQNFDRKCVRKYLVINSALEITGNVERNIGDLLRLWVEAKGAILVSGLVEEKHRQRDFAKFDAPR